MKTILPLFLFAAALPLACATEAGQPVATVPQSPCAGDREYRTTCGSDCPLVHVDASGHWYYCPADIAVCDAVGLPNPRLYHRTNCQANEAGQWRWTRLRAYELDGSNPLPPWWQGETNRGDTDGE